MNFQSFNFHPDVMSGIEALGYTEPTPIQARAIPAVIEGRDVIGLAQTGTGKTAAYVLPILHRLMPGPRGKIRALVIGPTRELAEQICGVFAELGKDTGLRSIPIYGGVSMDQQIRGLHIGDEIVVSCPGRLLDHVWRGSIDLSNVKIVVIDEADRMFDMGFQQDINKILQCMPQEKQVLLFSATMPDDIRQLVRKVQHNPVTVQIAIAAPPKSVSHSIYPVKQHLKSALLLALLNRNHMETVLIFTRTKHRTERVTQTLKRAGFRAVSLQGDLSQNRRQAAIEGFRSGAYRILVATDIASRGIDISNITHVVNYDMPENTDAYIHRIGRTGRVDQEGDALTFVTSEDAEMVRDIERILKSPLASQVLEGFDYKAPAPVITRPEGGGSRRPAGGFRQRSEAPRRRSTGRPTTHSTSRPASRPSSGQASRPASRPSTGRLQLSSHR
jgi:ATP-dependent RNA helicase RhlE